MDTLYEQFIRERQYLHNVSPNTIEGYRWAWKAFAPALTGRVIAARADLLQRVAELREGGNSAVTVNTYLRSINAFLRWLHEEGHAESLLRIPRLKEEQHVLQAFSEEMVRRLLLHKPVSVAESRIYVLSALLLDTGLRIDEALSLDRTKDVDLDQLLLTVRNGKGGKGRVVPFSLHLRRLLVRHLKQQVPQCGTLLFYSGLGDKIDQRNALRDFKTLCGRLRITGVRCSFHTLRHTFATAYLRNGGDVFRLQRILGHAKLEMTKRYVNLSVSDLQAVHQAFSPLTVSRRA